MLVCCIELQDQYSFRFSPWPVQAQTLQWTLGPGWGIEADEGILARIKNSVFQCEKEKKASCPARKCAFGEFSSKETFCTSGSQRNKIETELSVGPIF